TSQKGQLQDDGCRAVRQWEGGADSSPGAGPRHANHKKGKLVASFFYRALQNDAGPLRPAMKPQRMLPRQPAADVHDGWVLEESAAVILAAIAARNKKRTDQGQAYLAAVDVAGKHQVNLVA